MVRFGWAAKSGLGLSFAAAGALAVFACSSSDPPAQPGPVLEDAGAVDAEEAVDAADATTYVESTLRCQDAAFTEQEEEVKVLTINLRHDVDAWERRFPLIADEIVRLAPDVVGLQEIRVSRGQAQRLNELIAARGVAPYTLYEETKAGIVGQVTGEGVGIMTRLPIEERGVEALGVGGRVAVFARLRTPGGGVLTVFNTHLHHEGGDEVRLPQAQITTKFMREREGCGLSVLTGDMNANEDSATIRHFVASGLIDTYRDVHGDETPVTGNTTPIRLRDGGFEQNPNRRIDYVFQRPVVRFEGRAQVIDSVVGFENHDDAGLYPSDHLGVMSTVRMKF